MRRSLVRRIAVALLLLPLVAFSVFAEDIPITAGALRWEKFTPQNANDYVYSNPGGNLGRNASGTFSNNAVLYDGNNTTGVGYHYHFSYNNIVLSVDVISSVSTPKYDFYDVDSLTAYIVYGGVPETSTGLSPQNGSVRLLFSDDSSVTAGVSRPIQSNVAYPIVFKGIIPGSKSITSIRFIPYFWKAPYGVYDVTGNFVISEFNIVAPPQKPPEPIDPPTPPTAGGSMTSFKVTAKNSGFGFVGLFYEDIVNSLYQQAILSEAWSYAQYPYTTVFNYRAGDDVYYYLMVTDKPFLSDMEIFEDMIRYGTYSQGISGVVFQCRIPDSVMTAGEEYPFIPMTSFSNVGPYDFIKAVQNDTPLPVYGETAIDMGVALAGIMSFEDSAVSLYTVCSNYALSAQSVLDNPALKQSFKYADSWAQLLRLSSGDASALLQQILDSLRKDDKSETVYTRIEQIYEIMSNLEQLPADSPVQSAIDESVSALEDWADNIDTAQLDEIVAVTAAVSSGIEDIISALGILGLLGGVGLVLGVIKVVLQR